MRIAYYSDLQLDHPLSAARAKDGQLPYLNPKDADVLVIAGDLHPPLHRSLYVLQSIARRIPVVYVAGNRDFYNTSWDAEITQAQLIAREYGIHFLEAGRVELDGVCFVGGTLWTDYKLNGDVAQAMGDAAVGINDHRGLVNWSSNRRLWRPDDAAARHHETRTFIKDTLDQASGPVVAVSHHAPHPQSIAPAYAGSPLNAAFASDCSELMSHPNAPVLWVHGGLHHNVDYTVGKTRVVSNSQGYTDENPDFNGPAFADVSSPAPNLSR